MWKSKHHHKLRGRDVPAGFSLSSLEPVCDTETPTGGKVSINAKQRQVTYGSPYHFPSLVVVLKLVVAK